MICAVILLEFIVGASIITWLVCCKEMDSHKKKRTHKIIE
jgi:hypothetical protein